MFFFDFILNIIKKIINFIINITKYVMIMLFIFLCYKFIIVYMCNDIFINYLIYHIKLDILNNLFTFVE